MKITWIGHACFKIEKDNYAIVLDPYQDGSVPGIKPVREKADIVLCSHEHYDHGYREAITIENKGETPFTISTINTYHDDVQGAKRGPNIIHIISDGKTTIAHLGDLGCTLSDEDLNKLKNLDILLIPVGGYFTIDGNMASTLVKQLTPRIVIPMHFRDDNIPFGFDAIDTVDTFINNMDNVLTSDESSIESDIIFKNDIQTIILKPKNI